MQDKKTIALYPFEKPRHSLHKPVIEFLKHKYNIYYKPTNPRGNMTLWFKFTKSHYPRFFYHKFIRPLVSYNEVKSIFKNKKSKKPNFDLIYSVAKVPRKNIPYIIDFERINNIADHDYSRLDKKFLEKSFAQKNCKFIIPWYDIAERSLRETLNCKDFSNKIKTIPFGIKSTKITKNYNKEKIDLLFISSINNPLDFELKGGIIALETYKKLIKKHKNLNFVVRAHVPKWVKIKYSHLPGIKFVDSFMERKNLLKLMVDSDLFIQPKLGTNLALEAMNFAIPAVTFDEWEMPEMVIHEKNGFNVNSSRIYGPIDTKKEFQKYLKNYHLNHLKMYSKNPDKTIINDFVKYSSKIIEDKQLRIKMSKNAKKLVEKNGRYNFDTMKLNLLKVFESSLK